MTHHLINRCPHVTIRGIYGDMINHVHGFRLQCLDCGMLLYGPVDLANVKTYQDAIWKSDEKKEHRHNLRDERTRRRRYRTHYNLAYDGGGSEWDGYHNTYFCARVAAWWNIHIASWGGQAQIYDQRKEAMVDNENHT